MLVGKNDPTTECGLDGLEADLTKVQEMIAASEAAGLEDPRYHGDHVPKEIKDTFGLPKNMADYEIDFDEVRRSDAQYKRRTPVWSGQEVLDLGLNIDKSTWVLAKMNKIRVWPKGYYNTVKKARCLLKAFTRLRLFDNFLTLCVLVNTVVMAMDSYDIAAQTKADLEFLNEVFTWIFIVEMGIKLLAKQVELSWRGSPGLACVRGPALAA